MGLSMSRALGDFLFKGGMKLKPVEQQHVTAVPEVHTETILPDDEFLLLGCDGVFELNSCDEVVRILKEQLLKETPRKAVEELVDRCCADDRENQWPHG